MHKIKAPQLNNNDDDFLVVEWLVEEGGFVKVGDEILSVETSKAISTVEADAEGYIHRLVNVDDTVMNGEVIAILAETQEEALNPAILDGAETTAAHESGGDTQEEQLHQSVEIGDGSTASRKDPVKRTADVSQPPRVEKSGASKKNRSSQKQNRSSKKKAQSPAKLVTKARGKVSTTSAKAMKNLPPSNPAQPARVEKARSPKKSVFQTGTNVSGTSGKSRDKSSESSVLFSKSALEYIETHNIDADSLNLKGTITKRDLVAALGGDPEHFEENTKTEQTKPGGENPNSPMTKAIETSQQDDFTIETGIAPTSDNTPQNSATKVLPNTETTQANSHKGKRVSRAKSMEIELLTAGQEGGINSSLTVQFNSAELRRKFDELGAPNGFMLSQIITALSRQLRMTPEFNSYYSNSKIYTQKDIHIGVAMDMGNGLMTPVIRDADQKNALDIHKEIVDFSLKYINSSLVEKEIFGSTITVTDLSNDDILHFQPLINKEQACILGIGADRHQAGYPMTLTLVFDHRVLAGKIVASFLNQLKDQIFMVDEQLFNTGGSVNRASGEIPFENISTSEHGLGQALTEEAAAGKDSRENPSGLKEQEQKIIECFANVLALETDQVDQNMEISSILPTSKDIMQVTAALLKEFPEAPTTLLFECRLIGDVVRYFFPEETQSSVITNHSSPTMVAQRVHGGDHGLSDDHKKLISYATTERGQATTVFGPANSNSFPASQDVAIVGVSGRYPQCANVDEFWDALRNGLNLTTEIPGDRWDIDASYQESGEDGKSYCRKGGFLDDVNRFEASFFSISPKESKYMDPQQRLFLEVVWNLLENAGYTPESLSRQTGVYVGVIAGDYSIYTGNASVEGVSAYRSSDYYQIPNRVSHFFDLHGPSLAIDTACSASGTGIHLACEAIRSGEVETAIAGGVNLFLHPSRFIQYSQMKMISPENVCRPFSEDADGTLFGEGVGAVLLKSLQKAEADGDHIWGVIKATAVNSGGKTNGFTVPNPGAQAEMISNALNKANIGAETISYVEAHGTGTKLGDPIEIRGLTKAFVENGQRRNVNLEVGFCALGSVKSNIGHLESAAAISGLTKILFQMRDRVIAPTLGGGPDNKLLDLERSPFKIQRSLSGWDFEYPRRACLSSFGAGGVNSHLIVEEYAVNSLLDSKPSRVQEYQSEPVSKQEPGLIPILLSSTTDEKMKTYASRLKAKIEKQAKSLHPEEARIYLRRVAYTLFAGRVALKYRLVLWVESLEMLMEGLEVIANGGLPQNILSTVQTEATEKWIAGGDSALSGYFEEALRKVELPGYTFSGPEYRLPQSTQVKALQYRSEGTYGMETAFQGQEPTVKRYREIWQSADLKPAQEENKLPEEPILVFDEDRLFVATSEFSAEKDNISVVYINETQLSSPDIPKAWKQLIESSETASNGVLNLVYIYRRILSEYPAEDSKTQLVKAVTPLFHLLQALKDQVASKAVNLIYAGDWSDNYYGPALSGLARSLCIENPNYRIRNIDLVGTWPIEDIIPLLKSEFSQMRSGFEEIKYENGQRYLRKIVEGSSKETTDLAVSFRENGTYVITGGCGQLGTIVANDIARTPGIKLALLGSSGFDDRKQELLRNLQNRGARVEYFQANCANKESLQGALAEVRSRFGMVTGIVHCAGTIKDRYFTQKSLEEFLSVIQVKILGAIYLDQLTSDDQPELFLNFSSTSAFGNIGQTDYAFANRFLDAFSDWRAQRDRQTKRSASVSINWPYWQSGGMRIGQEDLTSLQTKYGLLPLESEVGLRTLKEILRSPEEGRIVLYGFSDQFEKQIEQWNQVDSKGFNGQNNTDGLVASHIDSSHSQEMIHVDNSELFAFTVAKISQIICEIAEIEQAEFSETDELEHYGFDSIMVNQFNAKIEAWLGATSKTLMYESSDVRGLAERLYESKTPELRNLYIVEKGLENIEKGQVQKQDVMRGREQFVDQAQGQQQRGIRGPKKTTDIAIVGIAGRYPGAPTLKQFWENLSEGRDSITEIPRDRWDLHQYYDADRAEAKHGKIYCKWGGFIDGAYDFDPLFFNISPVEAETLDPQERLFLENCWMALEDAGYAHRHAREAENDFGKDVGVYLGVTTNDHQILWSEARQQNNYQAPQSHPWSIANRVSYYFNFTGPSIAYDTACSSSLTAIHYACESLRLGETRMALAGGVNLYLHPAKYSEMCQMGMLSPTGRCHSFGDAADGFVPGEGVGSVVLKTLDDAVADGDYIYAVIKATAINHGGKVNGFTVPNPNAQKSLISDALKKADIDPRSISYVEAHGTGTKLGDPIEIAGLTGAYNQQGQDLGYCAIGSIKTNIGHLESAAGIAGLTKLVLQLQHKILVPSLNAEDENSNIDFKNTPFRVQKKREAWSIKDRGYGDKRRAALSSFGAGGNNAHLIIEEYVSLDDPGELKERKMFSSTGPFERETYRLVEPGKTNSSYFDAIQEIEGVFHLTKTVDPQSFVFSEHKINGVGSLPGVFSLDLVFRACREVDFIKGKVLLKNVVWVNPISIRDNHLLLRLTPLSEQQLKFEIVSGASMENPNSRAIALRETLYTTGKIELEPTISTSDVRGSDTTGILTERDTVSSTREERFPLPATLESLAGKNQNVEQLYQRMRNFGVLHGPGFQVIKDILCDGQKLLSAYQLPESLKPSFGEFIIHPAILDGAMQVIISLVRKTRVEAGDTPYLFFELKELDLLKPITESGYIYEELVSHGGDDSNVHKINVLFMDESGEISVRLKGAAIKAMPGKKPTTAALDLRRIWVESPLVEIAFKEDLHLKPVPGQLEKFASLLLFDQDEDLQKRLQIACEGRAFVEGQDGFIPDSDRLGSGQIILVTPGTAFFQKSSDHFEIDFTRREHYQRLLDSLNMEGVVVKNCVYHESREGSEDSLSAWGLTQFAAAFLESESPEKLSFLYLFQSRSGAVSPHSSGIKSLLKNLSLETTKVHFKSLEIVHSGQAFEQPVSEPVVKAILEELRVPPNQECHLRWEDSLRYAERWRQVAESISTESPWDSADPDQEKVYLVTGGMGGLGRHVVRDLLERANSQVILLGRRAVSPRELHDLYPDLQGRLRYFRCDLSEENEVRELGQKIQETYANLTTIYHAAGIIKDARFTSKTRADFLEVLLPKVRGTVNLGKLAKQMACEKVILFSSTASVLGASGQSDYAYANGFMDGYAARMNSLATQGDPRWISIGWPLWEEGGMHPDAASLQMMKKQYGQIPLETGVGLKYLRRYESCQESQVLLLIGDFEKYSKYLALETRPQVSNGPQVLASPQESVDENVGTMEFYTGEIQAFVISAISKIIKLSPQKISSTKELGAYGLDSLKLTELANQVNQWLDSDLMPSHFYEFTTVEAVSLHLWEEYEENIRKVIEAKQDERKPFNGMKPGLDQNGEGTLSENVAAGLSARKLVGEVLSIEPDCISVNDPLADMGFDASSYEALIDQVQSKARIEIPRKALYECSTTQEIEELFKSLNPTSFSGNATKIKMTDEVDQSRGNENEGWNGEMSRESMASQNYETQNINVSRSPFEIDATEGKVNSRDVAIIGMSGLFPGAENLDEFWENIKSGKNLITRIPGERWRWEDYEGDPAQGSYSNSQWGGFIRDIDCFDAAFFEISPREARYMDPQQRILIELVWQALEDSGRKVSDLTGSDTSVFVGVANSDYKELLKVGMDSVDAHMSTGVMSHSIISNRISYLLGTRGRSESIDTACSSSLVTIDRAIGTLLNGESELAIAAGVNALLSPTPYISFSKAGLLSRDGACKTFDESANGYVRAEGAGVVVLKSLAKALQDGDPIHAIIKGSAVNHGGHANTLTSPNTLAQAEVIIEAHKRANIDPRTIGYIEAHGTGTSLGDPIEIDGLKRAFKTLINDWESRNETSENAVGKQTSVPLAVNNKPISISSIKANIGHLETAAGVAGVIKAVLSMKNRYLTGNIHLRKQNPYISLANTPFRLLTETERWDAPSGINGERLPRRAGVSSFGFGGTNAHVVIEEYSAERRQDSIVDRERLIILSAKSQASLRGIVRALLHQLEQEATEISLASLEYTLQHARDEYAYRLALVADNEKELRAKLKNYLQGELYPKDGVFGTVDLEEISRPEKITALPADLRNPLNLAKFWVAGGEVSWGEVFPAGEGTRIHAPTYVFEKTSHWYRGFHQRETVRDTARAHPFQPETGASQKEEMSGWRESNLQDMVETGSKTGVKSGTGIPVGTEARTRHKNLASSRAEARGTGNVKLKAVKAEIVGDSRNTKQDQRTKIRLQPSRLLQQNSGGIMEHSDSASREDVSGQVLDTLVEILLCDKQAILEARTFNQLGLDSVLTTELCGILSGIFGFTLKATEIYDHHNFNKLVDYINQQKSGTANAASETVQNLAPRDKAAPVERVDLPAKGHVNTSEVDAEAIKPEIVRMVAEVLYMKAEDVRHQTAFSELGLDSILLVELAKNLSTRFGQTIKAVELYDNSNVEMLSRFIARSAVRPNAAMSHDETITDRGTEAGRENDASPTPAHAEEVVSQTSKQPVNIHPRVAVNDRNGYISEAAHQAVGISTRLPHPVTTSTKDNPSKADCQIAIIGISCRFPGAESPIQFWDNLYHGVDSIREVDPSRWDSQKLYSTDESLTDHINCKWGGFLDDVNMFDPKFFDIPYIEAKMMDPQQRIFLEQCWNALEDAGYTKQDLDQMNCGVNAGVIQNDYRSYFYGKEFEISHSLGMTGNSNSILASRISYLLNLKGPALTIDTACSSSLVAINMASNALVLGEVDMMLAGGVTLYLNEIPYLGMSNAGMLSKDGKCKVFDNAADGFVPAEGAGVVVLKRLANAEADGDHIYGVIRASGVNQDGKTNGITAPSIESQRDLEIRVYQKAGVDPADVSYVEAHGTGTILGDPIEVEALTQSFSNSSVNSKTQYCALGSVKSNIGHSSAAAGVAGLIKILMAFQHGTIPASLHYEKENRHLDLQNTPFFVNTKNKVWKTNDQQRRLAALSSFGFSGTNCHMVLEDYPSPENVPASEIFPQLFALSAHSEVALRERVSQMREYLALSSESLTPAAVASTLLRGRDHYTYRLAVVAEDLPSLSAILEDYLENRENPGYLYNHGETCPPNLKVSLTDYGNNILHGLSSSDRSAVDQTTLTILAELYTNDIALEWQHLYDRIDFGVVSLPTYPYEKVECWLEPAFTGKTKTLKTAVSAQGETAESTIRQTEDSKFRKSVSPIILKGTKSNPARIESIETAGVKNVSGEQESGRRKKKLKPLEKSAPPKKGEVLQQTGTVEDSAAFSKHDKAPVVSEWTDVINRILSEMLMVSVDSIDPELSFQEMGVDSIIGVEFVKELNRELNFDIATSNLYKYPCVKQLVDFLDETRMNRLNEKSAQISRKPSRLSTQSTSQDSGEVVSFLRATLSELLLVTGDEVPTDAPFADLGLDSIIGVEFIKNINRHYGVKVKSSSLYKYPDLGSFGRYLEGVLDKSTEKSGQLSSAELQHIVGIEELVSSLSGEELNREINRQLETMAN